MGKLPNSAMVSKIWSFYRPLPTQNNKDTYEVSIESASRTETKLICGIIIACLLLCVGVPSVYLIIKNSKCNPEDENCSGKYKPENTIKGDNIIGTGRTLRIITREEWGALPPNDNLKEFELPVNTVIINDTASNNCTTKDACILQIRAIQTLHMGSQFLDDIRYNFLVGGDGVAYEGRGWDKTVQDGIDSNISSIVIALIGNFANSSPPKRQLQAANLLIQKGVILNKVAPNYKLVPSGNCGGELVERLAELNIHN